MFILCSGRGILTIPIVIACALLVLPIVPADQARLLWPAYSAILSGLVIYFIGKQRTTNKPPSPQTDAVTKTQSKSMPQNRHQLCAIPMWYIGIVLILCGIGLMILSVMQ